jgi:nucleotide-binding universal stress UspA family protein
VLPFIKEFARNLQMELTLVQVLPRTNHAQLDVEAYLKGICNEMETMGITARYEVRIGSAADQIIDLADELASDLVAMSTHGQNTLNLWSLGSVAQKVLLGGNTPLLLIRA